MLQLADTSIRMYRKKNGQVSLRLHSYMMIHTKDQKFLLSAYLNQFDCSLTLESGEQGLLDDYGYTYNCLYKMEYMVHELWASGSTSMEKMTDTVGRLKIEYRLFSHPGQGSPEVIERVVPVLVRGPWKQRYSSIETYIND